MKIFRMLLLSFSVNVFAQELDSIDRSAVKRVVMQNLKLFQACYKDGLKNDPQLAGKIVLNWEIAKVSCTTQRNSCQRKLSFYFW